MINIVKSVKVWVKTNKNNLKLDQLPHAVIASITFWIIKLYKMSFGNLPYIHWKDVSFRVVNLISLKLIFCPCQICVKFAASSLYVVLYKLTVFGSKIFGQSNPALEMTNTHSLTPPLLSLSLTHTHTHTLSLTHTHTHVDGQRRESKQTDQWTMVQI